MSGAAALPWMGLGLSSNLDASQKPHPYRMLEVEPGLFDFVEYSAPLELEQARAEASLFSEMWNKRDQVPVLFHPVHLNLFGPHLEAPEDLAALDRHARAVNSPWVGNDIGWWHVSGEPFPGYLYIAPPLDEAGLHDAVIHAEHVRSHLSVPLVLENPAVIAVRGQWHVLDFMAKVQARTGCALLIDLGHLLSYQLAKKLPLTAGFDGFPFEEVAELHIAGGVVTHHGDRGVYVDDHSQPVREELFELLGEVLPRCKNLRALTFEGDGHPDAVAAITLRRLRPLLPARPHLKLPTPAPVSAPRETAPVELRTDHARLFEESYGIRPASEDAEGVAQELDFRLAVVAQNLDRGFPITRLLLAGTREGLLDFVRSDDFRSCFADSHRHVERAFFAWAAAKIRQLREPALEAVLAMESLRQRPGAGSAPGLVDLTEVDFAARALRRHLAARAWVSGSIDFSGLDALWQVARRVL